MQKVTKYFHNSVAELKKVVWPTRKVAIQLTTAVIVGALLIGTYLTVLGYGFQIMLQKLIIKS